MEWRQFILFLQINTANNSRYYVGNKYGRRLKSRKKDLLTDFRHKELHGSDFLEFFLVCVCVCVGFVFFFPYIRKEMVPTGDYLSSLQAGAETSCLGILAGCYLKTPQNPTLSGQSTMNKANWKNVKLCHNNCSALDK